MFLIRKRKLQAVRRPVTLRDHLVYAMTVSSFSVVLNVFMLMAMAFLVGMYAKGDTIKQRVSQWQAAEHRDLLLGNIPAYTSEACYMTLLKRLQATTDVREDGTVEISEVVWHEPAGDCSSLGPFPH